MFLFGYAIGRSRRGLVLRYEYFEKASPRSWPPCSATVTRSGHCFVGSRVHPIIVAMGMRGKVGFVMQIPC